MDKIYIIYIKVKTNNMGYGNNRQKNSNVISCGECFPDNVNRVRRFRFWIRWFGKNK